VTTALLIATYLIGTTVTYRLVAKWDRAYCVRRWPMHTWPDENDLMTVAISAFFWPVGLPICWALLRERTPRSLGGQPPYTPGARHP
jgi:hypothetical protein